MRNIPDRNVLEAIAHSLEFELYSIESSEGMETVYGLGWSRLQQITGMTAQDLEASTTRLAAAGLIHCGGAPHGVFDWLLGQRPAGYYWVTPEGHRVVDEHRTAEGAEVQPVIRRPG